METSKLQYSQIALNHKVHPVTVFLCTPRCGTQWLVKNLNEVYADETIVLHEPVGGGYNVKVNLGKHDAPAGSKENGEVNKHLDFIDEMTQHINYIEVGWPSIAGVSHFYRRFGEKLKLVHLYRNPINVAASMVTHNWYTGKIKNRFENMELTPFDEPSILKEYKSRWKRLNLFEKSLYYWTEINLRAMEIKYRYTNIPFFSLRFEDLFEEKEEVKRITLIETLSFMGLDYDGKILKATDTHHDNYRSRTSNKIDWNNIFNHPQTIALARKMGYRFDREMDLSRYKRSLFKEYMKKIRSILNRPLGIS